MVQTTTAMKRLAKEVGAVVQAHRLSGMTAEQAFTVLAINCGLQAAGGAPPDHVEKMCNVIVQAAKAA
jgi:hypothetical protein